MISGIFFVNNKGEMLIQRLYRDDVRKQAIDGFQERVQQKNIGVPVVFLEDASFMHVRQGDIYVVAVTTKNGNSTLVFTFLYKLIEVLRAYFGGALEEDRVRENFVLIYELLDEVMDYGYPQVTAVNVLSSYIKVGDVKEDPKAFLAAGGTEQITSEITGAVDWRQPGKHKYRKNEVYIDVLESVNLLMSNKGVVLRADVSGKIMMKAFLTGMPECKFGMNDKLVMERESKADPKAAKRREGTGIAIDDLTFHRCVRLGQFDTDRTISFIPPDGEFELMKYRITQNVSLPFRVIPVVQEHPRSRVEYEIKIKGNFASNLFATNVVLVIPTPPNAARCQIEETVGKAKYEPQQNAIVWKIKKFPGDSGYTLKAEVKLAAGIVDKPWARPPITMEFQVPMFTSSGLHVRFLKVFERSNYQTVKWVRYITRAGSYQIRI